MKALKAPGLELQASGLRGAQIQASELGLGCFRVWGLGLGFKDKSGRCSENRMPKPGTQVSFPPLNAGNRSPVKGILHQPTKFKTRTN